MSNIIAEQYNSYVGTKEKFEKFHKEVINMPRDSFSFQKLKQIRSIAAYLLLIKDNTSTEGNNYKQILGFIINNQRQGIYPEEKFRDKNYEENYFITNVPLDKLYKDKDKKHPEKGYLGVGRMFRHIMELCEFFGLVYSLSTQKKLVSYYKCEQVLLAEEQHLCALFRNYILNTNASTNTYIKSMFNLSDNSDFKPTICILEYISKLNRPVTKFETALLLGRIDDKILNAEIFGRALLIGKTLPATAEAQMEYIFKSMDWVDKDGNIFQYVASQEPEFKFNVYFLCMEQLGLIQINKVEETMQLTEYAKVLLSSSIPIEFRDLEQFAYAVEDDKDSDEEDENELIASLFRYDEEFKNRVRSGDDFIVALNFHSLNNPIYNSKNQRMRNKLVAEASKILANYTDQVTGIPGFRDRKGNYYCEAHHIIEFSIENGPDITDNLIVLNPMNHTCIHRGCEEDVNNIYAILKEKGILSKHLFERMINVYNCLTKNHIQVLFEKKIINKEEYDELYAKAV